MQPFHLLKDFFYDPELLKFSLPSRFSLLSSFSTSTAALYLFLFKTFGIQRQMLCPDSITFGITSPQRRSEPHSLILNLPNGPSLPLFPFTPRLASNTSVLHVIIII